MKLDRLNWSNRTTFSQKAEEGETHSRPSLPPVASIGDTDPNRRRSLQQEMEEIEVKAIGTFEGTDQIRHSAHEVAEKLASLGTGAIQLVRADKAVHCPGLFIDES